jgi:hypothetical protein
MLDHHLYVPAVLFCLKERRGHCEGKGKVVLQYVMKAYWGNESVAPLILSLGAIWGLVDSFRPLLL